MSIYFTIGAAALSIADYILLKSFDPVKCIVVAIIFTGTYFTVTNFKKKTTRQ